MRDQFRIQLRKPPRRTQPMNVHFAVSLILLGLILPTQYVLGHEESPIVALIPTSDEPGAHNMTEICPETLSDRNNLTTVSWFVIVVFLLTILVEIGTEKLNHFLMHPTLLHWKQISEHIYRELMILGLLSFLLFALTKWQVPTLIASIYNHNAAECEEEITELIEEAHMALFILAILYMVVVIFVMVLSKQIVNTWNEFELQLGLQPSRTDTMKLDRKCSLWIMWYLFPTRKQRALKAYKAFRTDMIRSRKLDKSFSFNRYLKYCLAELCLHNLVDIHWGGWCFAGVLVLLNWLRNFFLDLETGVSVGILMGSIAGAVQLFSLALYLWMLERCWPRNTAAGAGEGEIENDTSSVNVPISETTSLLSSGISRFQPKKNKYKAALDPNAKPLSSSREQSLSSGSKSDAKAASKNKAKNKKKQKPSLLDSSAGDFAPPASPTDSLTHQSSINRDSFALADGTTLHDIERAAKWQEEQLYGSSGMGEAIQFFKEASLKEDLSLYPFRRPGIFAHLLQLLLLGQAWYLGFCVYFAIQFRHEPTLHWLIFLGCSISPLITIFNFAPNFLPKYAMIKNVRGLGREDMIDRTWARQQAI